MVAQYHRAEVGMRRVVGPAKGLDLVSRACGGSVHKLDNCRFELFVTGLISNSHGVVLPRRFRPERYRRQGIAMMLMGAAFLVEAATNSHFPTGLLAVPLFAGSVATNLSATRCGGLGYRSKRAPWIVAAIALLAVVVRAAVFVFVFSGDSRSGCQGSHPANLIPACISGR